MSTVEGPRVIRVPQEEFDAFVAAATGGTFDLGARDETWDAGAAEKSYTLPADADCYMWKNPDGDAAAKSSYKLPFVSKQGGKHAVWGAITAIAGRLSSTQIPAADKKAVQSKVAGYYAKARKAYDDDKIETPFAADVDAARAFLADHDADFLDEDEVRAYLLLARYVTAPAEREPLTASLEHIELTAAADGGTAWTATLCVAGVPTVDSGMKRLLDPDGGSWLPLPLPLALMDDSPHADVVTKSPIVGRIDRISAAGNVYQAAGVFSDGSADPDVAAAGAKAVALVSERLITGISVDLVDTETEMMVYQAGGVEANTDDPDEVVEMDDYQAPRDLPADEMDDAPVAAGDEDELEYVVCFTRWVIAGATICPVQALTDATILVVAASGEQQWRQETEWKLPALTAAAAGLAPLKPPADWFDDPDLDGPTPLTVTDDGRVYGHLALWGSCHTGRPGACVQPPRSPSGYRNFHRGEIETADGGRVHVGVLTMNTGHAGLRLNAASTVAHYDDTGTQAAHVRAGEDPHGIWLAGAINPQLTEENVRVLRAAPPSGDWREVVRGEGLDLFAALAVNGQGFVVPRPQARMVASAEDEGWEPVALVAGGRVPTSVPSAEAVQRRVRVLAASADGIHALAQLATGGPA